MFLSVYDDSKKPHQTTTKNCSSQISREPPGVLVRSGDVVSSRGTLGHVRSSQQALHTEQSLLYDLPLGANSKVEYAQDRKKKKTLLKPICSWRFTVI